MESIFKNRLTGPGSHSALWRTPDYFSLKDLAPANWFKPNTIAGKIFRSPLIDPAGAALNMKADKAEKETLKKINEEYDKSITDSQVKLAEAVAAQQDVVALATEDQKKTAAEDQKKNLMLVIVVAVILGVGIVLILKKKK
ncbi:MAG: hypothetical protein LBL04_13950 [Bacteroidales bacterium]|jgi:hypothetical protein|nr:hypothetical protein [Bacteroidales bacterium]